VRLPGNGVAFLGLGEPDVEVGERRLVLELSERPIGERAVDLAL